MSGELLRGQTPVPSRHMAAKAKLICPLEHDSGVLWGGEPTVEYRLFQLLAENPLGLHLGQIKRALSRQHASGNVAEEVLTQSKYFCQTGALIWLSMTDTLQSHAFACGG